MFSFIRVTPSQLPLLADNRGSTVILYWCSYHCTLWFSIIYIHVLYVVLSKLHWLLHLIPLSWIIDSVLNFIRSHPLMDEAVAHKDNQPVFYMRDLFFTRLVVDVLDYVVFGNHLHYTVYYAATSKSNFSTVLNVYPFLNIPPIIIWMWILVFFSAHGWKRKGVFFFSSLNSLKLEKQYFMYNSFLYSYNMVNRGKYSRTNGPVLYIFWLA